MFFFFVFSLGPGLFITCVTVYVVGNINVSLSENSSDGGDFSIAGLLALWSGVTLNSEKKKNVKQIKKPLPVAATTCTGTSACR